MPKSYAQFKAMVLGRGYDIDYNYGWQCWDGYAEYSIYLGVPYANCTVTHYVQDIWTQRATNGILNYFTETRNLQPGDVVVFRPCSVTPTSHIAIFDSDAGGGYGNFLGQNQGNAASNPAGGYAFSITKLPYWATYDTAFRPKSWGGSYENVSSIGYSEKQLINETGTVTLTKAVNKRRDRPDGMVAETLPAGKKLTYTNKWVGNGHRYISWVEHQQDGCMYRYFVAISGSEKRGQDMWATIEGQTTEKKYDESQLINETGVAVLKTAVKKRRDTPTGIVAETLPAGKKLTYTQKWVGNGHRYVSWVETEPNGNKYRYFVAISGSETQGKDLWATIGPVNASESTTESKQTEKSTPKAGNTISTANIKGWGCDVSVHNPQGSVDLSKYDFVMIQSNFGEKTDNNAYKDKLFDYWVSEAKKAGIPFGVYCYDYAYDTTGACLEADYAVELAKASGATLGVWIDMEDEDKWKQKRGLWTRDHCLSVCETFCDTVQAAGMYTGVYCTQSIFDSWLNSEKMGKVDKWVAEWKTNDGYVHSDTSARGTIHQYSSITPDGKGLDLNVMYVSPDHYKMTDTGTENGHTKEENIKKDEEKEDTKDPVIIPKEEPQTQPEKDNAKANDNKNAKKNKGDKKKNKKGNEKKSAGMIRKIIKILMSTHQENVKK